MLGYTYVTFKYIFRAIRWVIVEASGGFAFLVLQYVRLIKRLGWKLATPLTAVIMVLAGYACLLALGDLDNMPGNTYSEGWRMGQLTHFAMDGNPIVQTGEAELMHGNNSSAGEVKNRSGKVIFRNPGYLSSTRAIHDHYTSLIGQYVAIHYRQVKVQLTTMNGDTDYRILDMINVDPTKVPATCGVTEGASSRGDGDDVGYLVKVSNKGNGFSSYEVVMQRGNASGTFEALSISDPAIYQCAQAFLKSGVQVKVHYTNSIMRDPLTADTTLNITGISSVPVLH